MSAADLAKLLSHALGQPQHAWRPILVLAGTAAAPEPPSPDDALGFFAEVPLKFGELADAERAVALTQGLADEVLARLASGAPLLALAPPPRHAVAWADALGHAILGFADGLDLADCDPDSLPESAAAAFEHLGRRSAVLLELADELRDAGGGDIEVEDRDELLAATEADVAAVVAAARALRTM